ncbi:hypothetical protein BRD56_00680 [Thermoplasmatales archaeon SW_10_69_26]|nr:MAG: hypothetical protein BRD56_00680 [Thermoplasmatales archaeon SW_10_69_26]
MVASERALIVGPAVLAVATGLAIFAAGASLEAGPTSGDDPEGAVMAEPREGDRGVLAPLGGDEGETTERELGWNSTTVQLPTGEERELPALLTWNTRTEEEQSDVRGDVQERTTRTYGHAFADLPGTASARVTEVTHRDTYDEGYAIHENRRTDLEVREECNPHLAPRLVDRAPDEAEQALADCLRNRVERHDEATSLSLATTSEWSTSEEHGDVWTANASLVYDNRTGERVELNVSVTTSPEVSLPLEVATHRRLLDEGETDGPGGLELVEWEAGGDALERDHDPLGTGPEIATVAWDGQGPTEGRFGTYPIADAREAVERTDEGEAFFEDADETLVESARFVENRESVGGAAIPTGSSSGASCQAREDPTPRAPGQADELSWRLSWASADSGELSAFVDAPRASQDNPTDRSLPLEETRAHRSEDRSQFFEFTSSLEGPALDELWAQRSLADAFTDEGVHVMEAGISHAYDREPEMTGHVGRASCWTSSDGTRTTQEVLVGFADGTATRVSQSFSEQHHEGNGLVDQPFHDDGEPPTRGQPWPSWLSEG